MPADYNRYFEFRQVAEADYANAIVPPYLDEVLPKDRAARVLDIGCGFGQLLSALKASGYSNLHGVDVGPEAVAACRGRGLEVTLIEDIDSYAAGVSARYDFIAMSHVLEHLPKPQIIDSLRRIRTDLLAPGGVFFLAVPNAQSHTGCYWRYEDFTHETLFTAGSLLFVLRAAGFASVKFLDPEGVAGSPPLTTFIKRLLLRYYRWRLHFWNKVTASAFHAPSPAIFSFELKAVARDAAPRP